MNDYRAYGRRDFLVAVNLAALLGWGAFVAPIIMEGGLSILPWAAILGLPVAFLACWVVGAPILWLVMARPITWFKALWLGAVISTGIASIGIAITRYLGWRQSQDPSSYSQIGGGDYIRSIDGILTPYGWWVLFQQTLIFVLSGVTVALVLRWLIGPGGVDPYRD
jgi:hypothetical protein